MVGRWVVVALLAGASACTEPKPGALTPAASASVRATAMATATASALPLPTASVSAPAATSAPLAVSHAAGCDVTVDQLLSADVYRGSPGSPMKYDSYQRDPAYARLARGLDHGAHYLSCTFRVRVNGQRYRYKHDSHGGPSSSELRAELCSEPAEATAVAADIARFTAQCKDLHGGEYYGDVLAPDDAADH